MITAREFVNSYFPCPSCPLRGSCFTTGTYEQLISAAMADSPETFQKIITQIDILRSSSPTSNAKPCFTSTRPNPGDFKIGNIHVV